MTAQDPTSYDANSRQLTCRGEWDLPNISNLQAQLRSIAWPTSGEVIFDGSGITKLDSAGAWLILQTQEQLQLQNIKINFQHFSKAHQSLLKIIDAKFTVEENTPLPKKKVPGWVTQAGIYAATQYNEMRQYLTFIGKLYFEALRILRNPKQFRIPSLVAVIYRTGFQALPIIALLSFMVGVVIAYQMGIQLRTYGANIYIVDFLGLSILREFGVLLSSIMVAGRTGSAFTAQLGIMKINQEIDALNTLGVTTAELLILPRILGLLIVMPLLTMWSNLFGIFGGMIMANNMLNITSYEFLLRFHQAISLSTLYIGLGKAPVFALIIGSIGCFQGVMVEGSADSVGRNTTRSVVLAIFFILLADAGFSIIFSKLNL